MMNRRTDKTLIVILLSAMLIAASGCGGDETPPAVGTAHIRGLLVDDATKRTLGNVRVRFVDSQGRIREALTSEAGVFEFENLPINEKLTLVVEVGEYKRYQSDVNLSRAEETVKITVNLVPISKIGELPPGDGLSVGTKAPDFNLGDGNNKRHSLADYAGKQRVVLLFDRGAG